jgi:hypothetical protein
MKNKIKSSIAILAILFPLLALAQPQPAKENQTEEKKNFTTGQRFSLRTNTVDWALMTPNVSVGFDLGSSPYSRMAMIFSGKYNWNTNPDQKTYHVYDILEGKVEVRRYYHTQQRNSPYEGFQKFFSPKRMDPRFWRAYYWGIYAAYSDLNLKLNSTGYKGTAIHGGVSFGMERSLFMYKTNSLDLEVGASAGVAHWDGSKYRLDKANNCYETKENFKKVTPVLSEVRVALVYRFGPSAKDRYLYDQAKSIQREDVKREKDKLKEEKKAAKKAKDAEKDAAKKAKKDAKDAKKNAKKEEKLNKKKADYQKKMDKKYGDEETAVEQTTVEQTTESNANNEE